MPDSAQTYQTHTRWLPVWHFFAAPVLALNVLAALYVAVRHQSLFTKWEVLVAVALLITIGTARTMAVSVQDRLIMLEERLRLAALLPADLRARMDGLTKPQLIGIRFASDAEVPELARRCLAGELTDRKSVKQAIKTWKPDTNRV